jgi:hypothetical protein
MLERIVYLHGVPVSGEQPSPIEREANFLAG